MTSRESLRFQRKPYLNVAGERAFGWREGPADDLEDANNNEDGDGAGRPGGALQAGTERQVVDCSRFFVEE